MKLVSGWGWDLRVIYIYNAAFRILSVCILSKKMAPCDWSSGSCRLYCLWSHWSDRFVRAQVYRGWNKQHLFSGVAVPSIMCAPQNKLDFYSPSEDCQYKCTFSIPGPCIVHLLNSITKMFQAKCVLH